MRRRTLVMSLVAALVGGAVPLSLAGSASAACPKQADECGRSYGDPSKHQTTDVFYAQKAPPSPRPAVIFVHGGGWWTGDKLMFAAMATAGANKTGVSVSHANYLRYLADNTDWAVFTMGYRLADNPFEPGFSGDTAQPWIDQPDDVETVVRWVKSHAGEFQINPDRVALVGASAGAQLALLHAYRSPEKVKTVVSWSGPTDMVTLAAWTGCLTPVCPAVPGTAGPLVQNFMGCAVTECLERYRQLSPMRHVDPTDPPTLDVHGYADVKVPYTQAVELRARLILDGVPQAFPPCPCGHWDSVSFVVAQNETEKWLRKRL